MGLWSPPQASRLSRPLWTSLAPGWLSWLGEQQRVPVSLPGCGCRLSAAPPSWSFQMAGSPSAHLSPFPRTFCSDVMDLLCFNNQEKVNCEDFPRTVAPGEPRPGGHCLLSTC